MLPQTGTGTWPTHGFVLYESLIRQVDRPEVIRLNYSGESLHYPQLANAIRLARATGATTELVSALGSASQAVVESLVDAGLHRLSVSIHSMDASQFRTIYGRGDISDVRARLDSLRRLKTARGTLYPEIDFAFVAMEQNLSQLRAVVDYAAGLGVTHVSIHPVIRRGQAPMQFPRELDDAGNLCAAFAARVREEVDAVSARHSGVWITIARPDHGPSEYTRGITTCEQNPWETIHVLANGAVVICEVQDRVEIGNLQRETLAQIWHGSTYQEFRRRYINGTHSACSVCPWRRTLAPSAGESILVRGWHPSGGEPLEWSQASAAMAVSLRPQVAKIRLAGILPPAPRGSANTLTIRHGSRVNQVVNRTRDLLAFEATLPPAAVLRFDTSHRFCPAEQESGPDLRNLGFALTDFELKNDERRPEKVRLSLQQLGRVERAAMLRPVMRWKMPQPCEPVTPGVSVLVPARDTPDLLAPTLAAAEAVLARTKEVSELIVVVTGAGQDAYAGLRGRFPSAAWLFRREALDYGLAVELGLTQARYPWLYLLNSDMHLRPDALAEVLKFRRSDRFAIGSRIRMQDGSSTETNWTDLHYPDQDAAELIERDPAEARAPRGCLYVGGGSGLFRASLLRRFIRRTRAYAPFYWEDVEWGSLAWRSGYTCTFCPASEAVHRHRQTISRYYSEAEVSRIFERNRLLFHLRNLGGVGRLENRLLSLDARTRAEIFQPRVLVQAAWRRALAFMAPQSEEVLRDRWKIEVP